MAGSKARKDKESGDLDNADENNPVIIKANIEALKDDIRGNNPEEDAKVEAEITRLEKLLKKATGGNPNTQKNKRKK